MHCKYCDGAFRLTKHHIEKDVCLECSGVIDDLTIDDEDIQLDIWNIKHPGGKTQVEMLDEYEND